MTTTIGVPCEAKSETAVNIDANTQFNIPNGDSANFQPSKNDSLAGNHFMDWQHYSANIRDDEDSHVSLPSNSAITPEESDLPDVNGAGSGIAQEVSLPSAGVHFSTNCNYNLSSESFTDSEVTGSKGVWSSGLDSASSPLTGVNLNLASSQHFDNENPTPDIVNPPNYQWSLGDRNPWIL